MSYRRWIFIFNKIPIRINSILLNIIRNEIMKMGKRINYFCTNQNEKLKLQYVGNRFLHKSAGNY
jgi:hypothetical protein